MIHNDNEFVARKERILLFERILAEARKTYSPTNYQAMAEGYLVAIEQMQAEIRAYLSTAILQAEAA